MLINKSKQSKALIGLLCWLFASLLACPVVGQPKIAVLVFELRDLTLLPAIPAELERTASVKPMLEDELSKSGFEIVQIPHESQVKASSGFGYLFDHHDLAAELGKKYNTDYVVVGRLHKPSFLFMYLMVHLIDVKNQRLIADYLSEVKGAEKKLTQKGVESLTVKINDTFNNLK
jgi:Protein of unknown function (DUF2380)